jgi:flagellar biogenesis protein FliO
VLLCLLAIKPAAGQAARPSTQSAISKSDAIAEAEPLRLSESDLKAAAARRSSNVTAGTSDLSRIAIALVIVIGVILLLRSGVRQMTATAIAGRSGKLVTVLSRSMVSPRQQVLVMQVGKRLIVVGDSAGRMNTLCEISDPDEVAMLIGQSMQAKLAVAERAVGSFRSLFGRANEPFEEVDAMQSQPEPQTNESARVIDPNDAVTGEEVRGLLDKVRMLQQQFKA